MILEMFLIAIAACKTLDLIQEPLLQFLRMF